MSAAPERVSDVDRGPLLLALRGIASAAVVHDTDRDDTEQASRSLRDLLLRTLETLAALQGLEDKEPILGDLCFAGAMELKRVLRELTAAAHLEDRLMAVETCRRKLRRAIRAVLEAASEPIDGPAADVASALAVRRLYTTFRRALRRPADESPEAVLVAVRYAAGALATLVTDPRYAEVRASDRAVLRRLRDRALAWARGDRGVASGLHLLEDVWTCGDLLRGISLRQELRAHDTALIAMVSRGPDEDVGAWFAHLEALVGLDDELDSILERARSLAGVARDSLVPEALMRLAQVH